MAAERAPDDAHAVVMGLGLFGGGVAAARHLVARGWRRVVVTDLRDAGVLARSVAALEGLGGAVELRLGEHLEEDFRTAALVVANPAVDPRNAFLAAAREGGARITSELELALDLAEGSTVVLVTGTQGKTSTTTFLHQLLAGAGVPARLGGNMGRPLLEEVAELAPGEVLCVEVSSYQLEALPARARAGVRVAVVTNVLVDHLERHGTVEAYGAAKARVLSMLEPGGLALLPAEWAGSEAAQRGLADGHPEGAAPSRRVQTHPPDPRQGTMLEVSGCRFSLESLPHLPAFQRANLSLALAAALELGASAEALQAALPSLRSPAHRAEVHHLAGRRVIDNGVCTTPDAALEVACEQPPGCTILLGGKRKTGLPFTALGKQLAERGDRLHLFGADRESLAEELRAAGCNPTEHPTFEAAIAAAVEDTPPGATLLFSPACASFDTHRNFEDRAQAFLALVRTALQADPGSHLGQPAAGTNETKA